MKYVLMITPNNFPNGDAGAVRDESFAKIYHSLGYQVIYIGKSRGKKSGEYNKINYFSMYKTNNNIISKIYNYFSYGKQLDILYRKIASNYGKPSLIHVYAINEFGMKWAKKKSLELGIPILHDSVEWYSECEFKYGKYSFAYILKDRLNRKLVDKPISVIAISRYLENYFKSKNLITTRIPVIMDKESYRRDLKYTNDKIEIVYAGSPAAKDYIKECIIGYCNLPEDARDKINFSIYGVGKEYVKSCCNERAIDNIHIYGRVSRETVISKLSTSDFSILLRPAKERYTKAGFPTKSVEAMMNGCAMICNLTSDLELYLRDNHNAIIVADCTAMEMEKALLKVTQLDRNEIERIKSNARTTAEKNFDYRKYITRIKEMIEESKSV